jgi:crotonobetainyl-CoA:carnitine CoA-transferase CaiB-like acyl-CoA transferase
MTARGAFATVPHPGRGSVRVTATPFRVDGQAPGPRGPAPHRVGEHTRKVLTEILGYKPERIEELRGLRAIESW